MRRRRPSSQCYCSFSCLIVCGGPGQRWRGGMELRRKGEMVAREFLNDAKIPKGGGGGGNRGLGQGL